MQISVKGSVENLEQGQNLKIEIADPEGKVVSEREAGIDEKGNFNATLQLTQNLRLWYPHTHGSQPLYTVTATLPDQHTVRRKLGIRRLRLLQHALKDAPGTSFVFEINNVRVFAGGSCWIPGDYLLPRFGRGRYKAWLGVAKEGGQNMVGGILSLSDFVSAFAGLFSFFLVASSETLRVSFRCTLKVLA